MQVDELQKQEFKDDIKALLDDDEGPEDFQVRSDEIKAQYNELFGSD